jgi:hypothetical protein
MSHASVLLEKRQKFREQWVDLEDAGPAGKGVRVRRPLLSGALTLQRKTVLDAVCECSVDWRGFREADLLPSGAEDAVPFDAALFRDVVADRPDWLAKIDNKLSAAIGAYAEELKDSLGNSAST